MTPRLRDQSRDGRPESRNALIPGLHRWLLFQEAREGAHARVVVGFENVGLKRIFIRRSDARRLAGRVTMSASS